MMHDPDTLASAYLDGELTDADRRVAEADPAVMAEVERLRALRAEVGTVDPPSDAARESAIAAAMAAYHGRYGAEPIGGDDAPHDDDIVVPFVRRFASPQWLGVAAAAVVLVVGVGVVATRGADDQDDGDFATAEVMSAADEPADDPASAGDLPDPNADRSTAADTDAADEAGDAADDIFATGAADDAETEMSLDMAEEPASEPADDTGGQLADEGIGAEESADGAAFPPPLDDPSLHFDDDVAIVGPLQLRAAASYLLERRDAGELGPTPEYRCEFYNVLGSAFFDDGVVVREILLEVDETRRIVDAVDRDACLIVASVELDEP